MRCFIFGHEIQWFEFATIKSLEKGRNILCLGACKRCAHGFMTTLIIDVVDAEKESEVQR